MELRDYFKITIKTFLLTTFISLALASQLYVYKDEFGNVAYSDSEPFDKPFEKYQVEPIQTVEWEKVSPIKRNNAVKSKSRNNTKYKDIKKKCLKYTKQIKKLENTLRNRLKASAFDTAKEQLSNTRRLYRKNC